MFIFDVHKSQLTLTLYYNYASINVKPERGGGRSGDNGELMAGFVLSLGLMRNEKMSKNVAFENKLQASKIYI